MLAAVLIAAAGCSAPRGPQLRVIDLLKNVEAAEKRPIHGEFHVEEHTFGGDRRATLVTPPESRVIWQTPLPGHARLQTSVAVAGAAAADAATFRIGISDDRIYESLVTRTVTVAESAAGWSPMAADLSLYGGRKLSLFYRPERRRWRIILTVNRAAGAPARVFWGVPGIDTDAASAQRFFKRQTH